MFDLSQIRVTSKSELYENISVFLEGLLYEERDAIANMSNMASLLFNVLPDVNWAGFYIFKEEQLVLGPFNGKPACIRIQLGKGVCGVAALKRETQLVEDVRNYKGHIPCDGETKSEIVIPIVKANQLIGVLDIDSEKINRFDEIDQKELEKIVRKLMGACDF